MAMACGSHHFYAHQNVLVTTRDQWICAANVILQATTPVELRRRIGSPRLPLNALIFPMTCGNSNGCKTCSLDQKRAAKTAFKAPEDLFFKYFAINSNLYHKFPSFLFIKLSRSGWMLACLARGCFRKYVFRVFKIKFVQL